MFVPPEGQQLPAESLCWAPGLAFPVPPREVIKASPHAPDPSAFSYAPPGEWPGIRNGVSRREGDPGLEWKEMARACEGNQLCF